MTTIIRKGTKNKSVDPGRYDMIPCPECKGKGKFLDADKKLLVCSLCGGFGFVKNESNTSNRN